MSDQTEASSFINISDNIISIGGSCTSTYAFFKQVHRQVPMEIFTETFNLTLNQEKVLAEYIKNNPNAIKELYIDKRSDILQKTLHALTGEHRIQRVEYFQRFFLTALLFIIGIVTFMGNYASEPLLSYVAIGMTALLVVAATYTFLQSRSFYIFTNTYMAYRGTLFKNQEWIAEYKDIEEVEIQHGPPGPRHALVFTTVDQQRYTVYFTKSIGKAFDTLSEEDQWILWNAVSPAGS